MAVSHGRKVAKMSKYKSQEKYKKDPTKVRQYLFRCYCSTEKDIIEAMESIDNKSSYIKALIKSDLEGNKTFFEKFQKNA